MASVLSEGVTQNAAGIASLAMTSSGRSARFPIIPERETGGVGEGDIVEVSAVSQVFSVFLDRA
jgi:hypothetical protein